MYNNISRRKFMDFFLSIIDKDPQRIGMSNSFSIIGDDGEPVVMSYAYMGISDVVQCRQFHEDAELLIVEDFHGNIKYYTLDQIEVMSKTRTSPSGVNYYNARLKGG